MMDEKDKIDNTENDATDPLNNFTEEDFEVEQSKFEIFIKVLSAIVGIAFFVGIIVLITLPHRQSLALWIALPGAFIFLLVAIVKRIIDWIKLLRHPKQTIAMVKDNIKEVTDAAKDLGTHYKNNYNKASKIQKIYIWFIFGPFLAIMLLMVAGVIIATYFPQIQVVGFVFMGVSFFGMLLWILTIVLIGKKNK